VWAGESGEVEVPFARRARHRCRNKRLWGFSKVRYRGMAKNGCRAFVPLALANIDLARGRHEG